MWILTLPTNRISFRTALKMLAACVVMISSLLNAQQVAGSPCKLKASIRSTVTDFEMAWVSNSDHLLPITASRQTTELQNSKPGLDPHAGEPCPNCLVPTFVQLDFNARFFETPPFHFVIKSDYEHPEPGPPRHSAASPLLFS